MSYEINYDDQRFKDVESDKKQAVSDLEKTYSGMINESDSYYQAQINASKEWEKKQTELQNQQTDFAIQEIEQQKAQEKKDYTKEQSGAYVDWQKQSNEYGAEAEQRAAQGLENTGFSESSQVSMYNTYQNRVAAARESYNKAVLNYNNAITQARLQNNSALAEIAYNALQKQLELSLQGFQYKNTLLLEQANKKTELEQMYHERWQDVLDQMNTENALAEEVRQFNEQMAWTKKVYNDSKASSSGGGGGGYSRKSSGGKSSSSSSSQISKSSGNSGSTNKSSSGGMSQETRDSLIKAGYAGKSAASVAKGLSSGTLKQYTAPSGNTVYKSSVPTSFGSYIEQKLKNAGLK